MEQGKILAIDDELNIRRLLRNEFSLEGFGVTTAKNGEEGLSLVESQDYDLVLLDIKLPGMSGMEVLKRIKDLRPALEVVMITGYGDVTSAVESMKLGARDYVTKPFKLRELIALVEQVISRRHPSPATGPEAGPYLAESEAIYCTSPEMRQVYKVVEKVARTDKTVLIQGETGVGKDVLARQIHYQSPRREGPFVTLDCGILNTNLAESQLYGHTKGAFSGAAEKKQGIVEASNHGTLFLDEIGNIDLDMQKKFLRFLETKKFRPVGSSKEVEVDVRLILATNMDLEKAVRQGSLREDLFFRMNLIAITIPPLRERKEDIALLAQHFLTLDAGAQPPKKLSVEALKLMADYEWPGNVRELRSMINKAALFAESSRIAPEDLPSQLSGRGLGDLSRTLSLAEIEKEHIVEVLRETGGNQTEAANLLGINRKTLYKKIHKYNIFS
jgi:DNA-binding NtrC family response regulator